MMGTGISIEKRKNIIYPTCSVPQTIKHIIFTKCRAPQDATSKFNSPIPYYDLLGLDKNTIK